MDAPKPLITFLHWKDPFRVSPEDYPDPLDQEVRDTIVACQERPFTPAGAHILGPMGIIPAAPQNSPSELYDLWVMHSNFNLNPAVVALACKVPGVELFRPWTRYRAWVGVGRLFQSDTVQAAIRHALDALFTPGQIDPAEKLASEARQIYPVWAVTTDLLGRMKLLHGDTDAGVLGRVTPSEVVVKASWM